MAAGSRLAAPLAAAMTEPPSAALYCVAAACISAYPHCYPWHCDVIRRAAALGERLWGKAHEPN
jgi:hypothetical protein